MKNKYVIFDLDDTLFYEIDYLRSAYLEIAGFINSKNQKSLYDQMLNWYNEGLNVFSIVQKKYPDFTVKILLDMYRNHFPTIKLNYGANELIQFCIRNNYKIGLISDGRSKTQRNKLKSLGIENIFSKIIISEEFGSSKPALENFQTFVESGIEDYYYIADNIAKDFVTPNYLGWITICLKDQGYNIYKQDIDVAKEHIPRYYIDNLKEAILLLQR